MKKYGFILFAIALFMACNDLTNSDLVGKWQLKTVEENGIETMVDTVWYNFQSQSVFAIQIYAPQPDRMYSLVGLKRQQDDVLSIRLESKAYLDYSDWPGTERSFVIEQLNKKRLTLRSEEGIRYSFIKF
jgi:hypothetical protein